MYFFISKVKISFQMVKFPSNDLAKMPIFSHHAPLFELGWNDPAHVRGVIVCFTDPFSLSLILTPAEPSLFPTTKHIPSYYHQREKRSADFGFWPCDPPYFNTVFSTLKVRESEWPGGLNLTNSSKANQPMWSSSWPNQPLRSNQLINCWGSHNTHENQKRYFCLPRNLCKGYYIPISLCTKLIILANYQTALVKIEK